MRASTHNERMKVNDCVKYSRPEAGEEIFRFILREINGDRVLIELICDWTLKPLETLPIEEVCPANE